MRVYPARGVALLLALAALITVAITRVQSAPQTLPEVVERFATVTGTVAYRERIALGPDAVMTVRLVDVSRADAPSVLLSEQRIVNPGQVPIPFSLWYNRESINPRNQYAVEATITRDGQLAWRNTTRYSVITQGNPSSVNLILTAVATGG